MQTDLSFTCVHDGIVIVRNGLHTQSSNVERDCLHFTSC